MSALSAVLRSRFEVPSSKFVFELVSEHGRPIAALIPAHFTGTQIRDIYMLLPATSLNSPLLAERWDFEIVAAPLEWSERQLRRVPCLPPKQTLKLAFL